jgi:pilus assembly protein Flp/PilA
MKNFRTILADEDGQGMVEYGLILGLIAIAAIGALIILGPKIKKIFDSANDAIPTITTAVPAA